MADQPGSKAELDKDGIPLGPDKAELDKDGIPLKPETEPQASAQGQPAGAATKNAPAKPETKSRKLLFIGVGAGAAVLIVLVLVAVLLLHGGKKAEEKAVGKPAAKVQTAVSVKGRILLDPFILTYTQLDKQQQGILIVKLSIDVAPGKEVNVQSSLYQIRSIVLERLTKNAPLYGKDELRELLASDLSRFGIRNVEFASFEQR